MSFTRRSSTAEKSRFMWNRNQLKKYPLAVLVLALAMPLVRGQQMILDKVVAKVGNEVVLYSDVASKVALMREQRAQVPPEADCMVFENEMVTNLLVNQAKLDSVIVSEEEIEGQMNARMNQILAMMNNDLELFQEVYGQSVSEMKNQVRDDMEKKLLAQRMQQQIMADIDVTPSEVIRFFSQIPADSLPYFNSEVELGEIVIYPEVNKEEKQKAYEKIKQVMDRLEAGEDFAELASTYSDDYGSARDGGNLGWNSRGTFVPEFEAAAYKLEKGGISDIVESQFGYHIIQLIERRGNSINSRHILVKPELTQADIDKSRELLDSVRQLVMSDSMTFQQAVKRYSDDREQSYSNGGRMVNPKSGDTFFEMADVDSDIFFAIDTIEVGEITAPIQFRARTGEPGLRIVQLQSRSIPHKASLQEDYSKIQMAAKDSKKNQAFNDWIEGRIKNTYIEIEEPFRSCPNMQTWLVEKEFSTGQARS